MLAVLLRHLLLDHANFLLLQIPVLLLLCFQLWDLTSLEGRAKEEGNACERSLEYE